MGLSDFILFPVYVFIFHLIFAARRKRINDPILRKYHLHGFWIKVGSALAFTIFSYYISPGDSTSLYYNEGSHIFHLILKDPGTHLKWIFSRGENFDEALLFDPYNAGYFRSESNYFIARLVIIFCFFCFGKYLLINLFFSMISFSGVWRLYKFFYEQYPHLHKKMAIAIIYLPTFVFWSSGILKDPICTGMLGWMTYSAYYVFYKRESIIKNSLVAFSAAYVLGAIKIYILISYLPFFVLFLVLKNIYRVKNPIGKFMLSIVMLSLSVFGFIIVAEQLQEQLGDFAVGELAESVKRNQTNYMNMANLAESSFTLGVEFDGSTSSLLKMAPAAIVATLYRPYLWESKKLSTLLSSLESLAMMLFTLYVFLRAGPFTFFGRIIKDPMVMFCFFYSVLFALFVGATTLNFGTLVRYKIPCMPFYLIALFLILETTKHKKKKNSLVLNEQAA